MAVKITCEEGEAPVVELPEIGDAIRIEGTDVILELVVDDPETGHTRIVAVEIFPGKILLELPWLK